MRSDDDGPVIHDPAPVEGRAGAVAARGRDARLGEMSDAVCRMGAMMLAAGTGAYRVKLAMGRVGAALGIDEIQSQVGLTEIVATTRAGGAFRTQVIEVPVPAVNTERISDLMRLSLRAEPGLTAADLQRDLDAIESRRGLHPDWQVVVGAVVACAAFAFLNDGHWPECVAAGVGAAAGKIAQLVMRRRPHVNQLAEVGLAGATAGMGYLLLVVLLRGSGLPVHEVAFTSALLFLVPGFPLMTAALDLARFDFSAGIARLFYAVMLILAASLGAWIVVWGFGLTPSALAPLSLPPVVFLLLRMLASFAGVVGFAWTFNTSARVAVVAGGIGAVTNLVRLYASAAGLHPLLAAVGATLLVGLLAGFCGQHILAPRITLSVPAVLIMIPGMAIYRALVSLMDQDWTGLLANGLQAVSVVVALAVGLVLARMLTDPAWTSRRPVWTQMPSTYAQRKLRHSDLD